MPPLSPQPPVKYSPGTAVDGITGTHIAAFVTITDFSNTPSTGLSLQFFATAVASLADSP
eukprot:2560538-Karenia_brevis.AAC.1